jgi:hypothetical protein
MIFCLLSTFIAYNLVVFFSLTRYTSPKLPLPSILTGINMLGPALISSSVVYELVLLATDACYYVAVVVISLGISYLVFICYGAYDILFFSGIEIES